MGLELDGAEVSMPLGTVFQVVAAVLFAIAFFWNPTPPPRWHFVAGGLFFLTLSFLFGAVHLG